MKGENEMNEYEQHKAVQNKRRNDLLEAAKIFLNRGTPVIVCKPNTTTPVDEESLLDMAKVERALIDNPLCNIAAVIGNDQSTIAFRFEHESPFEPDPMELLADLEKSIDELPATLTIEYPDKVQYRLYEYPTDRKVVIGHLDMGINIISDKYPGVPSRILLESSDFRGGVVIKSSFSSRISKLPDSWVNHICSAVESVASDLPAQEQASPVTEEELKYLPVPTVVEVHDFDDEANTNSGKFIGPDSSQVISPEDFLFLKVAQMHKSGERPAQIVPAVMDICNQNKFGFTYDDAFLLVLSVLCGLNCYEGLPEDEKLLRFVSDVELSVCKDHHKELCCIITPTGEVSILSIKNESKISQYLSYRVLKLTGSLPKDPTVKAVIKGLLVTGQFESPEMEMFNRVGMFEGQIYYDLGNENAVVINGHGWAMIPCPPIFRRYANHKAQVTPKTEGKLERFFEFVNYEEQDKLLLMVYMVASLIPKIAHPMLYVYGAHGSAKSSLSSKVKSVIDPSATEKLTLGKNKQEVTRNLKQYYVSLYDNISYLSGDISDLFCMASTGGGVDNRKLYTDEDSSIMSFKHCVILNGIKIAVKKPDLLDRSILIKLKRLDDDKRKTDDEVNSSFEEALPEILGGAFDVLSKAITLYPTITLYNLPRMADFAKWGYSIAEAIGEGQGNQFLKDYAANIADQNDLIAESNKLCHAVLELMENKTKHPTTIGKAYEDLKLLARTDSQDKTFPSRSNDLRPALEEIGPVLDSFGIRFEFGKARKTLGFTVTFTNSSIETEPPAE